MGISIIIPTLNEAANIGRLIRHLNQHSGEEVLEVIVVDGGSDDDTLDIAVAGGARGLRSPLRGRAAQMNYGAARARGEVLYFIHADTLPPATYIADVLRALESGYPIGCFRYRFDSDRWLLRLNAWFTRFDRLWCRGGDQSLFVRYDLFRELEGFCEDHVIMEEYDFIIRARRDHPFRIIPKYMLVSARKYDTNSYLRVQIANLIAFNMYRFGISTQRIYDTYRQILDYR